MTGKYTTDSGWTRIETLLDLFQIDERRRAAGKGTNWMTRACNTIRSSSWYNSIPVSELETSLASLPWWYSQLPGDKPKKQLTDEQRAARVANMLKARQAKEAYAAPYQATASKDSPPQRLGILCQG